MTEKCEPPPEVRPETWLGEFAAAAQKAGWEVEIALGNVAPPASVSSATVAALVEALEKAERHLVTWYRVGSPAGNVGAENAFADTDPIVKQARAALALYRGEAGR